MDKNYFQDIHYLRKKPNFLLNSVLSAAELFYGSIINIKNFLYKINILKEKKALPYVICVGNLTTGGVGKSPIVSYLANKIAKNTKAAIISRGYKSKLDINKLNIIKDFESVKYADGTICGDEPFEHAKNAQKNLIVMVTKNRKKGADYLAKNYGVEVVVLDDGFSNRKIKKDRTIIVIDSKMRFGNNHLLPKGPLREQLDELKRADEIILVDKNDVNFNEALIWAKDLAKKYNLKLKTVKMKPLEIYDICKNAVIQNTEKEAIAFCAIGQPKQFFDFAKEFYNLKEEISFDDHYNYKISDIKNFIKKAKEHNVKTFITTKKDEAKIIALLKKVENIKDYSFQVLTLGLEINDV